VTLTPLDQYDVRLRQASGSVARQELRRREQQLEITALLDYLYGVEGGDRSHVERIPGIPRTVGLSACQVGIMKQICMVDLSIGNRGYTDIYTLVNPSISWQSKTVVQRAEGCVNFPQIWGVTTRSRTVKVLALYRSGNQLELKLTGWPAILLQHEIDHINGRLFIDRLIDPSKAHLVEASDFLSYRLSKAKDWQKFIDVTRQTRPVSAF
jgi:peptide deformylase